MRVSIRITRGPLASAAAANGPVGVGARIVFEGIVRAREGERTIQALDYEAYRPMADELLRAIADETLAQYGLLTIDVEHSVGRVPVGACSFRLLIEASHRKEALAAMDSFIDRMKRDAPIWKMPVWE